MDPKRTLPDADVARKKKVRFKEIDAAAAVPEGSESLAPSQVI